MYFQKPISFDSYKPGKNDEVVVVYYELSRL